MEKKEDRSPRSSGLVGPQNSVASCESSSRLHRYIESGNYLGFLENFTEQVNPNERDEQNRTMLKVAVLNDRIDIIRALLQRGDARLGEGDELDESQSPLHAAARSDPVWVQRLIDGGAIVSAVDKLGLTPLHDAACEGRADCARVLLRAGAKLDFGDRYAKQPLHYAAESGFTEVISVLTGENAVTASHQDRTRSETLPTYPVVSHSHFLGNSCMCSSCIEKRAKSKSRLTGKRLVGASVIGVPSTISDMEDDLNVLQQMVFAEEEAISSTSSISVPSTIPVTPSSPGSRNRADSNRRKIEEIPHMFEVVPSLSPDKLFAGSAMAAASRKISSELEDQPMVVRITPIRPLPNSNLDSRKSIQAAVKQTGMDHLALNMQGGLNFGRESLEEKLRSSETLLVDFRPVFTEFLSAAKLDVTNEALMQESSLFFFQAVQRLFVPYIRPLSLAYLTEVDVVIIFPGFNMLMELSHVIVAADRPESIPEMPEKGIINYYGKKIEVHAPTMVYPDRLFSSIIKYNLEKLKIDNVSVAEAESNPSNAILADIIQANKKYKRIPLPATDPYVSYSTKRMTFSSEGSAISAFVEDHPEHELDSLNKLLQLKADEFNSKQQKLKNDSSKSLEKSNKLLTLENSPLSLDADTQIVEKRQRTNASLNRSSGAPREHYPFVSAGENLEFQYDGRIYKELTHCCDYCSHMERYDAINFFTQELYCRRISDLGHRNSSCCEISAIHDLCVVSLDSHVVVPEQCNFNRFLFNVERLHSEHVSHNTSDTDPSFQKRKPMSTSVFIPLSTLESQQLTNEANTISKMCHICGLQLPKNNSIPDIDKYLHIDVTKLDQNDPFVAAHVSRTEALSSVLDKSNDDISKGDVLNSINRSVKSREAYIRDIFDGDLALFLKTRFRIAEAVRLSEESNPLKRTAALKGVTSRSGSSNGDESSSSSLMMTTSGVYRPRKSIRDAVTESFQSSRDVLIELTVLLVKNFLTTGVANCVHRSSSSITSIDDGNSQSLRLTVFFDELSNLISSYISMSRSIMGTDFILPRSFSLFDNEIRILLSNNNCLIIDLSVWKVFVGNGRLKEVDLIDFMDSLLTEKLPVSLKSSFVNGRLLVLNRELNRTEGYSAVEEFPWSAEEMEYETVNQLMTHVLNDTFESSLPRSALDYISVRVSENEYGNRVHNHNPLLFDPDYARFLSMSLSHSMQQKRLSPNDAAQTLLTEMDRRPQDGFSLRFLEASSMGPLKPSNSPLNVVMDRQSTVIRSRMASRPAPSEGLSGKALAALSKSGRSASLDLSVPNQALLDRLLKEGLFFEGEESLPPRDGLDEDPYRRAHIVSRQRAAALAPNDLAFSIEDFTLGALGSSSASFSTAIVVGEELGVPRSLADATMLLQLLLANRTLEVVKKVKALESDSSTEKGGFLTLTAAERLNLIRRVKQRVMTIFEIPAIDIALYDIFRSNHQLIYLIHLTQRVSTALVLLGGSLEPSKVSNLDQDDIRLFLTLKSNLRKIAKSPIMKILLDEFPVPVGLCQRGRADVAAQSFLFCKHMGFPLDMSVIDTPQDHLGGIRGQFDRSMQYGLSEEQREGLFVKSFLEAKLFGDTSPSSTQSDSLHWSEGRLLARDILYPFILFNIANRSIGELTDLKLMDPFNMISRKVYTDDLTASINLDDEFLEKHRIRGFIDTDFGVESTSSDYFASSGVPNKTPSQRIVCTCDHPEYLEDSDHVSCPLYSTCPVHKPNKPKPVSHPREVTHSVPVKPLGVSGVPRVALDPILAGRVVMGYVDHFHHGYCQEQAPDTSRLNPSDCASLCTCDNLHDSGRNSADQYNVYFRKYYDQNNDLMSISALPRFSMLGLIEETLQASRSPDLRVVQDPITKEIKVVKETKVEALLPSVQSTVSENVDLISSVASPPDIDLASTYDFVVSNIRRLQESSQAIETPFSKIKELVQMGLREDVDDEGPDVAEKDCFSESESDSGSDFSDTDSESSNDSTEEESADDSSSSSLSEDYSRIFSSHFLPMSIPMPTSPSNLSPAVLNALDSTGRTPIFYATVKGRLPALKMLISLGADVRVTADDGKGLLHYAAMGGHEAVIVFLMSLREPTPSRDKDDSTILSSSGEVEEGKSIVKKKPGPLFNVNQADRAGQTPLYCAAEKGHLGAVRALLFHGADPNQPDKNQNGVTPFRRAAACGHVEVMKLLVAGGADPFWVSKTGNNALHDAAWNGRVEAVKLLIKYYRIAKGRVECQPGYAMDFSPGNMLNNVSALVRNMVIRNGGEETAVGDFAGSMTRELEEGVMMPLGLHYPEKGLDQCDNHLWTALHYAADHGQSTVIRLLLEAGASSSSRTEDSWTPLRLACKCSHLASVSVLLSMGANFLVDEEEEKYGQSPLHSAVRLRDREERNATVFSLIECGCDIEEADSEGWTPVHCAAANGHSDTLTMLLQAGATADRRDKHGLRPLREAAAVGNTEIVEILLRNSGYTPVHVGANASKSLVSRSSRMSDSLNPATGGVFSAKEVDQRAQAAVVAGVFDDESLESLVRSASAVFDDRKRAEVSEESQLHFVDRLRARVPPRSFVDINAVCEQGFSALHDACWQGRLDCVALLLSYGADPRIVSNDGRTPLYCAVQRGYVGIVRLLLPLLTVSDILDASVDGGKDIPCPLALALFDSSMLKLLLTVLYDVDDNAMLARAKELYSEASQSAENEFIESTVLPNNKYPYSITEYASVPTSSPLFQSLSTPVNHESDANSEFPLSQSPVTVSEATSSHPIYSLNKVASLLDSRVNVTSLFSATREHDNLASNNKFDQDSVDERSNSVSGGKKVMKTLSVSNLRKLKQWFSSSDNGSLLQLVDDTESKSGPVEVCIGNCKQCAERTRLETLTLEFEKKSNAGSPYASSVHGSSLHLTPSQRLLTSEEKGDISTDKWNTRPILNSKFALDTLQEFREEKRFESECNLLNSLKLKELENVHFDKWISNMLSIASSRDSTAFLSQLIPTDIDDIKLNLFQNFELTHPQRRFCPYQKQLLFLNFEGRLAFVSSELIIIPLNSSLQFIPQWDEVHIDALIGCSRLLDNYLLLNDFLTISGHVIPSNIASQYPSRYNNTLSILAEIGTSSSLESQKSIAASMDSAIAVPYYVQFCPATGPRHSEKSKLNTKMAKFIGGVALAISSEFCPSSLNSLESLPSPEIASFGNTGMKGSEGPELKVAEAVDDTSRYIVNPLTYDYLGDRTISPYDFEFVMDKYLDSLDRVLNTLHPRSGKSNLSRSDHTDNDKAIKSGVDVADELAEQRLVHATLLPSTFLLTSALSPRFSIFLNDRKGEFSDAIADRIVTFAGSHYNRLSLKDSSVASTSGDGIMSRSPESASSTTASSNTLIFGKMSTQQLLKRPLPPVVSSISRKVRAVSCATVLAHSSRSSQSVSNSSSSQKVDLSAWDVDTTLSLPNPNPRPNPLLNSDLPHAVVARLSPPMPKHSLGTENSEHIAVLCTPYEPNHSLRQGRSESQSDLFGSGFGRRLRNLPNNYMHKLVSVMSLAATLGNLSSLSLMLAVVTQMHLDFYRRFINGRRPFLIDYSVGMNKEVLKLLAEGVGDGPLPPLNSASCTPVNSSEFYSWFRNNVALQHSPALALTMHKMAPLMYVTRSAECQLNASMAAVVYMLLNARVRIPYSLKEFPLGSIATLMTSDDRLEPLLRAGVALHSQATAGPIDARADKISRELSDLSALGPVGTLLSKLLDPLYRFNDRVPFTGFSQVDYAFLYRLARRIIALEPHKSHFLLGGSTTVSSSTTEKATSNVSGYTSSTATGDVRLLLEDPQEIKEFLAHRETLTLQLTEPLQKLVCLQPQNDREMYSLTLAQIQRFQMSLLLFSPYVELPVPQLLDPVKASKLVEVPDASSSLTCYNDYFLLKKLYSMVSVACPTSASGGSSVVNRKQSVDEVLDAEASATAASTNVACPANAPDSLHLLPFSPMEILAATNGFSTPSVHSEGLLGKLYPCQLRGLDCVVLNVEVPLSSFPPGLSHRHDPANVSSAVVLDHLNALLSDAIPVAVNNRGLNTSFTTPSDTKDDKSRLDPRLAGLVGEDKKRMEAELARDETLRSVFHALAAREPDFKVTSRVHAPVNTSHKEYNEMKNAVMSNDVGISESLLYHPANSARPYSSAYSTLQFLNLVKQSKVSSGGKGFDSLMNMDSETPGFGKPSVTDAFNIMDAEGSSLRYVADHEGLKVNPRGAWLHPLDPSDDCPSNYTGIAAHPRIYGPNSNSRISAELVSYYNRMEQIPPKSTSGENSEWKPSKLVEVLSTYKLTSSLPRSRGVTTLQSKSSEVFNHLLLEGRKRRLIGFSMSSDFGSHYGSTQADHSVHPNASGSVSTTSKAVFSSQLNQSDLLSVSSSYFNTNKSTSTVEDDIAALTSMAYGVPWATDEAVVEYLSMLDHFRCAPSHLAVAPISSSLASDSKAKPQYGPFVPVSSPLNHSHVKDSSSGSTAFHPLLYHPDRALTFDYHPFFNSMMLNKYGTPLVNFTPSELRGNGYLAHLRRQDALLNRYIRDNLLRSTRLMNLNILRVYQHTNLYSFGGIAVHRSEFPYVGFASSWGARQLHLRAPFSSNMVKRSLLSSASGEKLIVGVSPVCSPADSSTTVSSGSGGGLLELLGDKKGKIIERLAGSASSSHSSNKMDFNNFFHDSSHNVDLSRFMITDKLARGRLSSPSEAVYVSQEVMPYEDVHLRRMEPFILHRSEPPVPSSVPPPRRTVPVDPRQTFLMSLVYVVDPRFGLEMWSFEDSLLMDEAVRVCRGRTSAHARALELDLLALIEEEEEGDKKKKKKNKKGKDKQKDIDVSLPSSSVSAPAPTSAPAPAPTSAPTPAPAPAPTPTSAPAPAPAPPIPTPARSATSMLLSVPPTVKASKSTISKDSTPPSKDSTPKDSISTPTVASHSKAISSTSKHPKGGKVAIVDSKASNLASAAVVPPSSSASAPSPVVATSVVQPTPTPSSSSTKGANKLNVPAKALGTASLPSGNIINSAINTSSTSGPVGGSTSDNLNAAPSFSASGSTHKSSVIEPITSVKPSAPVGVAPHSQVASLSSGSGNANSRKNSDVPHKYNSNLMKSYESRPAVTPTVPTEAPSGATSAAPPPSAPSWASLVVAEPSEVIMPSSTLSPAATSSHSSVMSVSSQSDTASLPTPDATPATLPSSLPIPSSINGMNTNGLGMNMSMNMGNPNGMGMNMNSAGMNMNVGMNPVLSSLLSAPDGLQKLQLLQSLSPNFNPFDPGNALLTTMLLQSLQNMNPMMMMMMMQNNFSFGNNFMNMPHSGSSHHADPSSSVPSQMYPEALKSTGLPNNGTNFSGFNGVTNIHDVRGNMNNTVGMTVPGDTNRQGAIPLSFLEESAGVGGGHFQTPSFSNASLNPFFSNTTGIDTTLNNGLGLNTARDNYGSTLSTVESGVSNFNISTFGDLNGNTAPSLPFVSFNHNLNSDHLNDPNNTSLGGLLNSNIDLNFMDLDDLLNNNR